MPPSRVVLLTQSGSEIAAIVALSENHKIGNTVTDFPIEGGFKIADGAQNIPAVLSFIGIVPDDLVQYAKRPKLNVERVEAAYQRAAKKVFSEAATPRIDFGADQSLAQGVRDVLEEICKKRIVLTVVTGFRVYVNMIMLDYTEPGDGTTINDLKFSTTLKQITVAESEVIFIDEENLKEDAIPSAATAQDVGKQPADEPDETTQVKAASALSWLTGIGRKP